MPRRNLFRAEDVLLGLVNLVAPTTLHVGLDRSDDPSAGLGLVLLLALLGAVAAIGLRPADQPAIAAGGLQAPRIVLVGPLLGGLFLVGALAGEQLGMSDGSLIGGLGVVAAGLAAAGARYLPVTSPGIRRALVTPLILVGAGIFSSFAGGIIGGLDVAGMIRDAPAVGIGFAVFASVLLLGGIGAFYAMFVAAPRELADPEMSRLLWIPRFVLFVITALLGLGIVLL
jgi:hypothetical protein